jgi:hypothetical protein
MNRPAGLANCLRLSLIRHENNAYEGKKNYNYKRFFHLTSSLIFLVSFHEKGTTFFNEIIYSQESQKIL